MMATFKGTQRVDRLKGTARRNSLLGLGGNDRLFGLKGSDILDGGKGNDILEGGIGSDELIGGRGRDQLIGGRGDDIYNVDSTDDRITERSNQGTDTVQASINWTLGAGLENLTLLGNAIVGIGNALNNVMIGNSANNTLDGRGGADSLSGKLGDDTYVVDNTGDLILELNSQGTDTVQASIDWMLGDNLEILSLQGAAISGTGNSLNNTVTGNNANNILDGGSGADSLSGGLGNDTYVVDSYSIFDPRDRITELPNQGIDLVRSSVNYFMDDNVENLEFLGAANHSGYGNNLNNAMTGNVGDDYLTGGGGQDQLIGGQGNDIYVVDDVGDRVTEQANEGTSDSVFASVDWTLGANLESLFLEGSAVRGSGNELDNSILGNSFDNLLDGAGGSDFMIGGKGNDTYIVDDDQDLITEFSGEGIDLVRSSTDSYSLNDNVENLELLSLAEIGSGNSLDNKITGNSAVNALTGLAGNDTLTGGQGSDGFVFTGLQTQTFVNADIGLDLITDFSLRDGDAIGLPQQVFGLGSASGFGFSVSSEFASVIDDASAAASLATIVFSNATQTLFYNPNRSAAGFGAVGASGAFAVINIIDGQTLTASSFLIV
jgi:Ca2+-binding RTX toxin-like protein